MSQSTTTAIVIAVAILGAAISGGVARRKGRSTVGYGLLGLLLPLIGIVVALVVPDRSRRP